MPSAPCLTREDIEHSAHIVGQIGTEPYISAFEQGAQVVIAGRSCEIGLGLSGFLSAIATDKNDGYC